MGRQGPRIMDSEVMRDGHIVAMMDKEWCSDKLPMEDIAVPVMELPELEPDNGPTTETLKEMEQKWNDLGMSKFIDQHNTSVG